MNTFLMLGLIILLLIVVDGTIIWFCYKSLKGQNTIKFKRS